MSQLTEIRKGVNLLLEADVLDNTFGVMNKLKAALEKQAAQASYTADEKREYIALLTRLSSESIREALHKHELPITNAIIRNKNVILTRLGVTPDEFHQEIDPKKYPHSW